MLLNRNLLQFVLILSYSFLHLHADAQVVRIYGSGLSTKLDTAQIGFHPSASLFEDVTLGEKNLFGIPPQGTDLRVLQRTAGMQDCVRPEFDSIAYSENFDSKINLRPPTSDTPENLEFYIKVNSDSIFTLYFQAIEGIPTVLESAKVVLDSCNSSVLDLDWGWVPPTAQVFFYESINQPIYAIVVRFKSDVVSTNSFANPQNDVLFYPNPNKGSINVTSDGRLNASILNLYDQAGHRVLTKTLDTHQQIQLPNRISNGFYLIEFIFKNGQRVTKPFILQRI